MVTIRLDRRAFTVLAAIVGIGVPLIAGIALGRWLGSPRGEDATPVPPLAIGQQPGASTPFQVTLPAPTADPTIEALPRISVAEAARQLDQPSALFVDVRTASIYEQGHVKGALNVPELQLADYVDKLPKDKQLILYCS